MANKIILKKSSVQDKVPLPGDLDYGELALNYRDGWLYYKDINNNVLKLNEPPPAGSGSGADADLLDGLDSTEFLRSNNSDEYTVGTLTFNAGTEIKYQTSSIVSATGTVGNITGSGPWFADITALDGTTGLAVGALAGSLVDATPGTGALYGGTPTRVEVNTILNATSIRIKVTGGTTPVAGSITDLKVLGSQVKFENAIGVKPFAVTSTTLVDNLNADLLDGKDYLFFYSPDNPPPATAEQDTLQTVTTRGSTSDVASITFTASTVQVGIGNNNPQGKLHITHGSSERTYLECSSAGLLSPFSMWNTNTGTTAGTGMVFQTGSNVATGFIGGVASQLIDASNSRTALRVLSNGALTGADATAVFYIQGGANGVSAVVDGTLNHKGLVLNEYTLTTPAANKVDELVVFTKSLTITTDWQDTGIQYNDLATGTYIVQLYANDVSAGGTSNNEYYSGIMSWFAGNTSTSVELPTDEIPLHRAGASSDAGLYLRTYRTEAGDPTNLKLQIYSNLANASATNYVFKFRRMI